MKFNFLSYDTEFDLLNDDYDCEYMKIHIFELQKK